MESWGAVVKYSAKATSRIPTREIVNEVRATALMALRTKAFVKVPLMMASVTMKPGNQIIGGPAHGLQRGLGEERRS